MIRTIINQYRDAYQGLPRAVWVLAGTLFINRTGGMVLPFLALYMTQEIQATAAQVSYVLAAHGLGSIIGSQLGGWLCRHMSYHYIQLGSLVGSGIGFLCLTVFDSPTAIAVNYLLISSVNEAFRPANGAAVASACPKVDRARGMALIRMAVNLGMTIAPVVGGLLASIDYAWIFIFDGATCLLAAIFMANVAYDRGSNATSNSDQLKSVRSPWRDHQLIMLMLLSFPSMLIFFQLFTTWPIYITQDRGFSELEFGLFMAISTILVVAFEMILAHRLSEVSPRKVIAYGALLTGMGLALLPIAPTSLAVIATIIVWTFGEMLFVPFLSTEVANLSNDLNRGAYMGLYVMAFSIGWVVAPAAGLSIYQQFGADYLWFICGVIALVQFLLIFLWLKLVPVLEPLP